MNQSLVETPRRGRPVNAERVKSKKLEILGAAAACFGKFGYTQTDVNLIAARVGITKGTIYHYFGSKEKLFLATVDAEVQRMKDAVLDAADEQSDPLDELVAVVFSYLEFASSNPHFVELLIEERATFKDREKPTYFMHRDETLPRWHRCIERLIADGRARPCDPEQFVSVLSDTLYGTIFTDYFTGKKYSAKERAQSVINIVLNGILTEAIPTEVNL